MSVYICISTLMFHFLLSFIYLSSAEGIRKGGEGSSKAGGKGIGER